MRIERRYTTAGQSPYRPIAFRRATSEIRNPDGSLVFRLDGIEAPEAWSQVACDVLAQKYFRKAGVPARLKRVEETGVPSLLWRSVPDEAALAAFPRSSASARRLRPARCSTGSPALDLLGLEGRLLRHRGGRAAPSTTSCASCWRRRWARRTRRSGSTPACTGPTASTARPGALLRRLPDRRADHVRVSLRASAAARLLHPVRRRTTSSTRAASWTCGCARRACSNTAPAPAPTSPRCAARASGCRAAASRPGLMSFLKIGDRAAGGDQVGRHHAPRRQDGGGRHRPPGHRGLHRLEGEGGAEGRRPGRRLEDRRKHLKASCAPASTARPRATPASTRRGTRR